MLNEKYEYRDIYTKECVGALYNFKECEVNCIILGEFGDRLKVKGYFITNIDKPYEQIRIIKKDKMRYLYKKH
jgi:hypothetical protein